jgi:chromatin remodeling complex protein RSC6
MQSNAHNYLNRTNNRVVSINQKLKKVISKFSNIVTFLEDLMRVVSSLRMERDHKVIVVFEILIKGIHILMFSEEEYMTTG